MLLPPGPEQSSLMMTLRRGWVEANEPASKRKTIASSIFSLVFRKEKRADAKKGWGQIEMTLNLPRI
jgi:hypothetical protein